MNRQREHGKMVWDPCIRWFHWINVLSILGLIALGTTILFDRNLGVSTEGKIILKTTHVYVGYVFCLNLVTRLIWAFVGPENARWRTIFPNKRTLRSIAGSAAPDAGDARTPLGRVMITIMFLLLIAMSMTGLVLGGTDVFMPPLGQVMAEWVAAPGINPSDVLPYRPDMVDPAALAEMRSFRKPIKMVHEYSFYALIILICLHIGSNVFSEIKHKSARISAMFTGYRTEE